MAPKPNRSVRHKMYEMEVERSISDLPVWALKAAGYSSPSTPERKAKSKKGFVDAARMTALDYGQASSLHGINYIFESGKNLLSSRGLIQRKIIGLRFGLKNHLRWA